MKLALRRLFKSPAFALTAIITVGAAIGANALIFSVVNGIILKPLPFPAPASLVGVWHVAPGVMPGPLQQSAATYFMYRDAAQVFEDIGLSDVAQVARLHEQLVHGIEAVAGVQSVGVSSSVTMDGSNNDPIWIEDFPNAGAGIPPLRRHKNIGENYFKTMGNPVIAGRDLTWADAHNLQPVATLVMRLLSTLLYGVSPFDPITYAIVIAALSAVTLVATWLPARQATRVDPMSALRAD